MDSEGRTGREEGPEQSKKQEKCLVTEQKCIYFPMERGEGTSLEGGRAEAQPRTRSMSLTALTAVHLPGPGTRPRYLPPKPITACCLGAQVPQECELAFDDTMRAGGLWEVD